MYNVNPFPPPFGVCSICQKHDCGVSPDGEKWIQIPLELFKGGDIHIGYNCIKSMSDNFGITQEVVEREVLLTPTDEQIGNYVRNAVKSHYSIEHEQQIERESQYANLGHGVVIPMSEFIEKIKLMDRSELKNHLAQKDIPFVPQWGEERLREEALKHV